MPNLNFQTQVSGTHEGVHYIRNTPLSQLVKEASFASVIFYMITNRLPSKGEEKVFNAILIASIDHGLQPASGFVPRVVASTGNDLLHSLAAGLMALGPYHGGAISGAAEILVQIKEHGLESLQESHFNSKKRILGLGHPHYKHSDPRSDQLFELAKQNGLNQTYQDLMLDLQKHIYETLDKHLVINIDGAIAALLLDMGFPAEAGNGLFALARVGGMIPHVLEESQEKPVRRLDEDQVTFTLPQQTEEQA